MLILVMLTISNLSCVFSHTVGKLKINGDLSKTSVKAIIEAAESLLPTPVAAYTRVSLRERVGHLHHILLIVYHHPAQTTAHT